ncbi:MAG TPA: hypothetical protein ENN22_16235 [bacterium]|nr:hypothetical protein [bacterium]
MNEVIAILFIIAAIFSFINKALKQKQTSRDSSAPSPVEKPEVWKFPWEFELEQDETDSESVLEDFSAEDRVQEETFPPEPSKPDAFSQQREEIMPQVFQADKEPVTTTRFESMGINLKSKATLKRGIIMAEILGKCKAEQI